MYLIIFNEGNIMKKLLAMLIAGAFATASFAADASAPMAKEEGKAPASASKKANKKHHKANKKHHAKKEAASAE